MTTEIKEVIRYKNLTAELSREGYKYKWYCPQTQTATYVSASYPFEELLERGEIWLIHTYNYQKEKTI